MHKIQLSQDIKPLSEFRANVASCIDQVNKTNRPLVITSHGKSAAVLLNVSEYESLIDKLELLEDVRKAEKQIVEGKTVRHAVVRNRVLKRLRDDS